MTQNLKHTIVVLFIHLLTMVVSTEAFPCTCISFDEQRTEAEFKFSDLAVKGRIIAESEYTYYDTAELTLAKIRFDKKTYSYLIRKYKVFSLVIDSKFKSTTPIRDTIQILTGFGGGDCGYQFELGKEYIVYVQSWKEKNITIQRKKRKDKRMVVETSVENKFYTDICRFTQKANSKELEKLKRLVE